jgi:predicted XRE-type DNA-binding protein
MNELKTTRLMNLLNQRGLSQRRAALLLDVDTSLFHALAHGKRPNQRTALRVAEGLAVEVRELWPDFERLRGW